MKKVNLIAVFTPNADKVLMCLRAKDPYKDMLNFVGGKVKEGENALAAAYRELREETGIDAKDIVLTHFMDFVYHVMDTELELYVGRLNHQVDVVEEANQLYWIDMTEDFFDTKRFAGVGNIGHMIEFIKLYKDTVLA